MDIFFVVVVMSVVTYIPRLLPLMFFRAERINPGFKRFLSFIPYAALGALIIPGSFSAVSGKPFVSVTAVVITVAVAWFNRNIILTVALSVASVYIMLLAGITF